MSLSKLAVDLDNISKLDDEPNDVGGMTAADLKAKFDEGPNAIKNYLNNTLTEEAASKAEVQDIVLGQIPDNTITTEKLSTEVNTSINSKAPNALSVELAGLLGLSGNPLVSDALTKLSGAALRKAIPTRTATTISAIPNGATVVCESNSYRKIATDYHGTATTLQFLNFVAAVQMYTTSSYSGSNVDTQCTNAYNALPSTLKSACVDVTLSDVSLTRKCFCLSRSELNGGISYFSSNASRALSAGEYWTRTYYAASGGYDLYYFVQTTGSVLASGSTEVYGVAPAFAVSDSLPVYLDSDGKYYTEQAYTRSLIDMSGADFPLAYAKIATGSYTGTGTYGSDNPNSLTFSFAPKILFLFGSGYQGYSAVVTAFVGITGTVGSFKGSSTAFSSWVSFSSTSVSWYASGPDAGYQYNVSGQTYRYLAIG